MHKFRDLVEAKETIVFAFGRFNPPTTGHEKLIQKTASVAGSNPFRIYPSFTTNPKKDPLPHTLKVAYMRKMFKKYAKNIIADNDAKTAIMIAEKLYNEGFKNLVMVAGSDRIKEFSTLLNRYNDAPDKKGNQLFKFDSVNVVSAGERDPDAEGVEGMSASKMRAAASDGDMDSFLQGVPSGFADGKKLYRNVRKYMGIREERDMGDMNNYDELRDAYLTGKVWNVGDVVEANGVVGEIVRKGTNYLSFVTEDGKVHKAWLHEVELDEGKKEKYPARQLIDPNKEVLVVKKNSVVVIDKINQDYYLKKGWSLAEKTDLDEIKSSRPRAGGPKSIEKSIKKHIELTKKYMKQGMSKEEASKKAFKDIVKEEVELNEEWWDKVIAKLDQMTHPKQYGKMIQDYAELMKQPEYLKHPNMAADKIAREYNGVGVREFIKYINKLVVKKILPQELKAEYEMENTSMFTFKEFVDEMQEKKQSGFPVTSGGRGFQPPKWATRPDTEAEKRGEKSIDRHADEAGIPRRLLKHRLEGESNSKHKDKAGKVKVGDPHLQDKAYGIGQIRNPALSAVNKAYDTKTTMADIKKDKHKNIQTSARYLKMLHKNTGNAREDEIDTHTAYRAGPKIGGHEGTTTRKAETAKFEKSFGKGPTKPKTPAVPSGTAVLSPKQGQQGARPPIPARKPKKEEFGVNENDADGKKPKLRQAQSRLKALSPVFHNLGRTTDTMMNKIGKGIKRGSDHHGQDFLDPASAKIAKAAHKYTTGPVATKQRKNPHQYEKMQRAREQQARKPASEEMTFKEFANEIQERSDFKNVPIPRHKPDPLPSLMPPSLQIKQQRKHAMRKLPFGKGGSEQGYPARRDKGPYKPSPSDADLPIHGPKSEPSKDDPFGHQDALVGVKPGSKDWPSGIGPAYRRPDENRVKRGLETGLPSAAAKAMFTGPGGSESPASKLKRDRERFKKLKPTPGGGDLRVTREDMTFKDFVNQIQERPLTNTELNRREEIAKDLSDTDFKQRYGDRWMEVKMGVATKMAKKES